MPIQVYQGEDLEAREATPEEAYKLQKRADLKSQIKDLYKDLAEIDESLPQKTALIADISDGKERTTRTHVIDEPTGQFVTFKKLDLVMDSKTTKKLLKEFNKA